LSLIKRASISAHRVGLARPSLSIGEDADIVPVQEALHKVLHFLIDVRLALFLPEHHVKVEVGFLQTSANL